MAQWRLIFVMFFVICTYLLYHKRNEQLKFKVEVSRMPVEIGEYEVPSLSELKLEKRQVKGGSDQIYPNLSKTVQGFDWDSFRIIASVVSGLLFLIPIYEATGMLLRKAINDDDDARFAPYVLLLCCFLHLLVYYGMRPDRIALYFCIAGICSYTVHCAVYMFFGSSTIPKEATFVMFIAILSISVCSVLQSVKVLQIVAAIYSAFGYGWSFYVCVLIYQKHNYKVAFCDFFLAVVALVAQSIWFASGLHGKVVSFEIAFLLGVAFYAAHAAFVTFFFFNGLRKSRDF